MSRKSTSRVTVGSFALVLLAIIALLVARAVAQPQMTIVVNDPGDEIVGGAGGNCTLRDAITLAQGGSIAPDTCATSGTGTPTIIFNISSVTITLGGTLPTITNTVTIDGTGQGITLSGANSNEIFFVNQGATLNLQALTLANGNTGVGAASNGGAIANLGTLTVTKCTFSGNSSLDGFGGGGAISNEGSLTISASSFSGNTESGGGSLILPAGGGAIANQGVNATLNICPFAFRICDTWGSASTPVNLSFRRAAGAD
jgi:hypothetical protein